MKKVEIDESKLRQLIDDDLKNSEIAAYFGVHWRTIQNRMQAMGIKRKTGPKMGERHPDWKGGRKFVKGYLYIYSPDHPNCTKDRYVSEHRLVMEKKLGRYLRRKEVVHHLDENPLNNDPTNLVVFRSNGEHLVEHLRGNPYHAQRCREGRLKSLQKKQSRDQSESDALSDTQTTDHQTS